MNSLLTISECNNWILEQCQTILACIEKGDFDVKVLVQKTLDSMILLISSLDISKRDQTALLHKLERYSTFKQNNYTMKLLILNIKEICCQVPHKDEKSYLSVTTSQFLREEERIASLSQDCLVKCHTSFCADQIYENACWFRNYFIGKPYITLIGPVFDDENDLAVISIIKEMRTQKTCFQYRIIVRTSQDSNMCFVVKEIDATELMLQLVSKGQTHTLDLDNETKRSRPLRSFSSALITSISTQNCSQQQETYSTRLMRASLLFLFQDIDFKLFKELTAEMTILSGLEKEILRYDELEIPKCYKFGLITIREGQTTEEEWFANSNLSTTLEKLLNIIGHPVKLKNYTGYAAGLDTKTGESGEVSFVSSWKDYEIMFHVAPLMPSRENDVQQIHRKRYIGNDIVCIIFIEGKNQKFDPSSIRSQFLHVFIIVRVETINRQDVWRVEIVCNRDVKTFPPPIPSPPVFYDEHELRSFLISKLISAENFSLKSEKFALLNNKARLQVFKNLIEIGLRISQVARSFAGHGEERHHNKKYDNYGRGKRPKSVGAQQSSSSLHNSLDTNRNVSMAHQPLMPNIPPVPTVSKSSMLRDLKGLTRKSGKEQNRHSSTSLMNYSKQQQNKFLVQNEAQKKSHLECEMEPHAPTSTSGSKNSVSNIRYKAHNLMSTMMGRRKSRNDA
ncbi:MAG: hypothetical protein EXX96DRAFT_553823 [Benjaminiella poitrasii]|nr:MAG: hypothetical protein EXX96DRAFT_553823 [Benjaminiella poitrasii]